MVKRLVVRTAQPSWPTARRPIAHDPVVIEAYLGTKQRALK